MFRTQIRWFINSYSSQNQFSLLPRMLIYYTWPIKVTNFKKALFRDFGLPENGFSPLFLSSSFFSPLKKSFSYFQKVMQVFCYLCIINTKNLHGPLTFWKQNLSRSNLWCEWWTIVGPEIKQKVWHGETHCLPMS